MQIGGFQKLSLIDYPGKVACVIFTQGCNFRCSFCHNKELVIPSCFNAAIPQDEIIRFLEKRKDVLQGVVVSGGEPTLQKDLIPFLREVKQTGYAVKLDTNGSHPWILKEIIAGHLIDYIAMDIKAPLDQYSQIAGVDMNIGNIRESIDLILQSSVEYVFRTTVVKPLFPPEAIQKIVSLVRGTPHYILQNFVPRESLLDKALLAETPYTEEEFGALQKLCRAPALV